MWFSFVLIVVIFALLTRLYIKKTYRIKCVLDNMPGPKGLPIVGSAFDVGTKPEELFQAAFKLYEEFGPAVVTWFGPEAYILLSSVEDIEMILSHNRLINKNYTYEFFDSWLGKGLLISGGELWHKRRKLITPAFHFQILEQFIDIFNRNTAILTGRLRDEVGKPGFDMEKYISLCVLDIIAESSMGLEINAQKDMSSPFVSAIREIAFSILYRTTKPWLHMEWAFRLSKTGRNYYKNLKIIHNFVEEVVQNKRKKRQKFKSSKAPETTATDSSLLGMKKRSAFLDLLLDFSDAGGDLTNEEIKDEVNTFMFAGHDTTNAAISFALYGLMKNQDVQENVMKELKEIFGDSDKMPTYSDLQNMKYLEKVIKESLRLWPSVPYIGRSVTEDIKLKTGYTLPKGSSVILFLNQLHYNPQLFPEPHKFNPDRFDKVNSQGRNPFAFCPFSAGPRNCIGQKFAMLEMKAVLSTVLRNFKLLPPIGLPDIRLSSELVLCSTTGVNIRIVNRNS